MFKQLLVNFFGSYSPPVLSGDYSVIPDGLAGVDFVWIGKVFLFICFLLVLRKFLCILIDRR